jgi:methionyl aminopeptidase
MAITYRGEAEIELLRISNDLVSRTHGEVAKWVKPGISFLKLDKIAEEFIRDNGATPAFLGYEGFPNTLCISPNEQVVHGIPSGKEIEDGDIISIDCGVKKDGYYGDSAYTYAVGEVQSRTLKLLHVTKEALYLAIEKAVVGGRLGDIGHTVQKHVHNHGFTVVREMVGHGIGTNLHEEPQVLNYGRRGSGIRLKEGLVIAIEPMINMGKRNIVQEKDGWTVRSQDKKPSAHFEHTVVVRKNKAEILSTFKYIEEVLNNL